MLCDVASICVSRWVHYVLVGSEFAMIADLPLGVERTRLAAHGCLALHLGRFGGARLRFGDLYWFLNSKIREADTMLKLAETPYAETC